MREWYEPETTKEEVEKVTTDLATFMKKTCWWALLGKLRQSREKIQVYTYDDACDMHDAIYLTGQGFIGPAGHPVENLVEIVEGFMTNVFYGAAKDGWNSQQRRRPSQFIPWLESLCLSHGLQI